jgi:putative hemolysin
VPVFIEGGNSRFFNLAGMVHPILRTVLLARELVRRAKNPEPVRVHIGTPIPYSRLKKLENDADLISYMRLATYVMGNRPSVTTQPTSLPTGTEEPLAESVPSNVLQAEIDSLPAECKLLTNGDYEVYMGRYQQMPQIMQEIGRGREEAFRFAGGGTRKAVDLAPQDEYYHHLFLWHTKDKAIVGAYRLGLSDEILKDHGPLGLICSGLFNFKPEFLRQLNPGIELGRSYVSPKYMRNYNSLLLLWAGILQFVVREPKYKMCFGSVGISQGDEYSPASRSLIVDYMKHHLSHPTLSLEVESRSPFTGVPIKGVKAGEADRLLQSVEDVSVMVSGLEPDGKGVPILIKHYARMNAKLLSFGVWTNHSNAVVSFIVADLTIADPKFLKRYMGEDGYQRFMAHHGMTAELSA